MLPDRPRRADPHKPGVREQLLVHSGRLRCGPESDPVELSAGDFVAFDGAVAHVYEALDGDGGGRHARYGLARLSRCAPSSPSTSC